MGEIGRRRWEWIVHTFMKSEKSITKLAMENDQMLLSHSETGSLRVEAEDLRDGRTQGLPSAGITNK